MFVVLLLFPFERIWLRTSLAYMFTCFCWLCVLWQPGKLQWKMTRFQKSYLKPWVQGLLLSVSKLFDKLWTDCICIWKLVPEEAFPWAFSKDFQICVERDEYHIEYILISCALFSLLYGEHPFLYENSLTSEVSLLPTFFLIHTGEVCPVYSHSLQNTGEKSQF